MYKRSEPNSHDMHSQGTHNYQGGKEQVNSNKDEENNALQYYINNEKTIQILKNKGIKTLYPIQYKTYRHIFNGKDVIARDRTGSGKTMAFVLPVVQRFRESKFEHKYPKFLIILPTRQLAMQVYNQIQSLRYRDGSDFVPYVVYGKTNIEENIRRLREGVDILVATPGRLNDLVQKGAVKLQSIQVICLDEADEILKQGFKEEIEKVFSQIHKVNSKKIQTLLFSATIPQWLKDLSYQYQSQDTPYINMISQNEIRTSKTIKHYAVQISRLGEIQVVRLIEQMVDKYGGYEKRILIFCDKKVEVDSLSRNLRIQNQPLHGDVAQTRRQHAYRNFKAGLLKCIVATNVAARGLDFPSVDLVIQMTPPLNTEQYIHRAGRTGRAGKEGACMTFFDRTKSRVIGKIEDEARINFQQIRIDITKLVDSNRDFERNDRNPRQQRGRYDQNGGGNRYDRGDRGDRGNPYERSDNRRNDRNEFSSSNGNRYGDRNQSNNNWESRGPSNFDRNQNRDPRPQRGNYESSRNDSGRYTRQQPNIQSNQRKNSRSKSRSASKQRKTSPRRQFSVSPKRDRSNSPKRNNSRQEGSRPSQNNHQDTDY